MCKFTLPSSGVKPMTTRGHGKEPHTVKATNPLTGTKAPANHDLLGKPGPGSNRGAHSLGLGIPVPCNL